MRIFSTSSAAFALAVAAAPFASAQQHARVESVRWMTGCWRQVVSPPTKRVVYHAEPSGQTPADFTATFVSDTAVVFENAKHDFPQRVSYRRVGSDSLVARVDGKVNGKERAVEFPYHRVGCAER